MDFTFSTKDFLTFEETGEEDDWGAPLVIVRFLGVEVERSAVRMWGTEKADQGIDDYEEKAARAVQLLWKMANGENSE